MDKPDLAKALAIPGWSTEQELTWLANHARKSATIAEIGSWRGRSARAMADNTDAIIFCIDTWADDAIGNYGWWTPQESPDKYKTKDWLWSEFRNNLGRYIGNKVIPIRMTSAEAFELLIQRGVKFDMVFIDGAHDYENVKRDVMTWEHLIKPNGILCGHDYNDPTCPDVALAINSLLPRIELTGTIWRAYQRGSNASL